MNKKLFFILSSFLLAFLLYQRIDWICSLETIPPTDGYYYLQEFRSYLEQDSGYYQQSELFFRTTSILGSILSLTPQATIHLLAGISLVCFASALFLFLPAQARWLAPAAISLFFLSDILFVRHYAFLRQAFSWSLFLLCYSMFSARYERTTSAARAASTLIWRALALYAACLHIFTAIIATFLFIGTTVKTKWIQWSAFLLLACAVILFASISDRPLLSTGSFLIRSYGPSRYLELSPYELLEYFSSAILAIFLLLGCIITKNVGTALFYFSVLALILFLPLWTEDGGMALRLQISSFWILIPAVVLGVRTISFNQIGLCAFLLYYLVQVAGYFLLSRTHYPVTNQAASLFQSYGKQLKQWIPANAFVYAPQGMNFAVTYYLGLPSAKSFPRKNTHAPLVIITPASLYPGSEQCFKLESDTAAIPRDAGCVNINDQWILSKASD